jgi:hypothetical protein
VPRGNIRLQYPFRITDGNQAGICSEVPPPQGMKLAAIVAGLAAVDHKDAFEANRVKYWLYEINLHRSDLSDRQRSGRPPFEDIDARILQVLETEPWSSV